MIYGSVCSGIEAATVAWEPLGWEPAWFSEIEPFPCAVLKHRYPRVPNHGDMTTLPARILAGEVEAPDVLVGGTPCQSFSVAGLRQGLKDPRGQLTRTYVEICDAIDTVRAAAGKPPVILVWENVPGVLSDRDNAFGNFLGALSGEDGPLEPPGGKWTNAGLVCGPARDLAWRVLDAQYFGVAQRRRRVFLVGHSRAGALRPVKVLLVEQGVQRHSAPSREAGQRVAPTLAARTRGGGGLGTDFDLDGGLVRHDGGRAGVAYGHVVAPPLCMAHGQGGAEIRVDGAPSLTCNHEAPIVFSDSGLNGQDAYTGRVLPVVQCVTGERTHALKAEGADGSEDGTGRGTPIVTSIGFYPTDGRDFPAFNELSPTVKIGSGGTSGNPPRVMSAMAVRRLTPTECERLQGFPDDYTRIPWKGKPASECPDGPRYKALGNSMAVPVMRWIGERIAKVEAV